MDPSPSGIAKACSSLGFCFAGVHARKTENDTYHRMAYKHHYFVHESSDARVVYSVLNWIFQIYKYNYEPRVKRIIFGG